MKGVYRSFALATAVMAVLFVGYRLLPPEPAAVPVMQTEPSVHIEEVTEPTQTAPTEETLSPEELACEEVGRKISAGNVFVYDVTERKMLYCNTQSTDTLYPASITKLFSAWVALQILEPDTVVTAGRELGLLQPGSSTAYIAYGSSLTVQMLVEAMMLPSGNDAAYVLAAAAGRKLADDETLSAKNAVAAFIEEMNRMAQEVGLVNSHFETPDGYHSENHYSCPGDLATIGELALGNETIAEFVGLQQDSVVFASGETITWYNTNRLLNPESAWYCENAIGMKTGYTQEAGYCLLAAFQDGQRQILVGVFDSANKLSRYSDAADLFHAVINE